MRGVKYERNKIGSHGVDRTHTVKAKCLLTSDLAAIRDSMYIGKAISFITDIWTLKGQARLTVTGYVSEIYPNFCVVDVLWMNEKESLVLRRCLQYKDMLVSAKRGEKLVVDCKDKSFDREALRER